MDDNTPIYHRVTRGETPLPNETPNVVIENPHARKVARVILDAVGLVLGTAIVVDAASAAFDLSSFTVPFLAGWTYVRAGFGFTVDNPNTPSV